MSAKKWMTARAIAGATWATVGHRKKTTKPPAWWPGASSSVIHLTCDLLPSDVSLSCLRGACDVTGDAAAADALERHVRARRWWCVARFPLDGTRAGGAAERVAVAIACDKVEGLRGVVRIRSRLPHSGLQSKSIAPCSEWRGTLQWMETNRIWAKSKWHRHLRSRRRCSTRKHEHLNACRGAISAPPQVSARAAKTEVRYGAFVPTVQTRDR